MADQLAGSVEKEPTQGRDFLFFEIIRQGEKLHGGDDIIGQKAEETGSNPWVIMAITYWVNF